jgi:hypothetical protein
MSTQISRRAMLGRLAVIAGAAVLSRRALATVYQLNYTYHYPFNLVDLNSVVIGEVVFSFTPNCSRLPVGDTQCMLGDFDASLGIADISQISIYSNGIQGRMGAWGPVTLANLDLSLSNSGDYGPTSVTIQNGIATLNSLELYLTGTPGVVGNTFCTVQSGAQYTNTATIETNLGGSLALFSGTWQPGTPTRT